ncbi:MAG: hypothetical protein KAG10_00585, partial [Methylococcales bacterium]|nr:hypothetical protein [Methylococcales bacterium]
NRGMKDAQNIVLLFHEIVAIDQTAEALQILDETGAGERWRPLREALMVIVSGNERYLNSVAPEVREPAQAILKQLRLK